LVPQLNYRATIGGFVAALRPNPKFLNPEFLYHWMSSDAAQRRLRSLARQTTNISNLPPSEMARAMIPLPPLMEQERIVTVLREAAELRRIRTQIYEATKLLVPSIFDEMFGSATAWTHHQKLSTVTEIQGGIQVSARRDSISLRVPYLRVANVHRGRLDISEVKQIGLTESELERTKLRQGDVLIVEGHGNPEEIGRAAVWTGEIDPCVHQNHLIRVRCSDRIDPIFLAAAINGHLGRRYFQMSGNTTSGLNTISTKKVAEFRLPVPPIESQRIFAAMVTDVEDFRASSIASEKFDSEFDNSLAAYAFTGELTARWRERNRSELMTQVRERDAALRSVGVKSPASSAPTIAERESRAGARKEGAFAELTAQQEALLDELESIAQRTAQEAALPGGASTTAYAVFTPASLSAVAPARLRHQPDLIRRELEVLATRGLVLRVSRRRHREAYEPDAFGDLYRLPVKPLRFGEFKFGEESRFVADENIRDNELSQLATKLGGRAPV
jgi:type I restriction enzyme S subunit